MCPHSNRILRKESVTIRNIVLLAGLAAFLAGCVVVPNPGQPRRHVGQHDNRPHDIPASSYEGYFYARIIFINNVPYYVHDDRNIRPIPAHLHNHFRRYSYNTTREPLVFSGDTEVRDGYPMSRIVYLNGVPYHVTDDRVARPLPGHLHQRFGLVLSNQADAMNRNGAQPPVHNEDRRNEAPAYGRAPGVPPDVGQGRARFAPFFGRAQGDNGNNASPPVTQNGNRPSEPPAYGRGQDRGEPPASGQDRARFGQAPFGQRQGGTGNRPSEPPSYGNSQDKSGPPARGWNNDRMARPPLPPQQHPGNNPGPARAQGSVMPPAEANDSRRMPPMAQQANMPRDQRNTGRASTSARPADNRGGNGGRQPAGTGTSKERLSKKDARKGKDGDSDKEEKDSHKGKEGESGNAQGKNRN